MRQTKLHYFLTLLMLFALATVNAVADTTIKTVDFTSWTAQEISDKSTVNDCYFAGAGEITSDGFKLSGNMKVSNYYVAIPLTGVNGSITVTVNSVDRPQLCYAITSTASSITSVESVARPSTTGNTSVTFTVSGISSSTTYLCLGRSSSNTSYIKSVTVTTPDAPTPTTQNILIGDLRFEHLMYNPSRSNVAGFNISAPGWQTNTTTATTDNIYTLLLNKVNDNSITISTNSANSNRKILRVVLYGAYGASTFDNATVTSAYTSKYSDSGNNIGALVWENASGASSATISITSSDRPHIYSIDVTTDGEMSWSKQNVVLSFSPNSSGTASINQTDYSLDSKVVASINGGSLEAFRPDDFTSSSVTGDATFNTYHESTNKVGVNTGASAGVATVTATFGGNNFYNAATEGTYTLNVVDANTHTASITVDDMRISKKVNNNGLNSNNNNLDRSLGGFDFTFTGGEGVKFNNDNYLLLRVQDGDTGVITITPKKSSEGTFTITRVDLTTSASSNGTVSVNEGAAQTINGVTSYSFSGLTGETATLKAGSGSVFITGFTIYYTDPSGVINTANVAPTISFSKSSDNVTSGDAYTSPTISTSNPKNFDITVTSNNTSVATVASANWASTSLVALSGEAGSATITASAASSTYFNAATSATYTINVAAGSDVAAQKWNFTTLNVTNTITNDTGFGGESGWEKDGEYYKNKFTTSDRTSYADYTPIAPSQLEGLKFGRNDNSGLAAGGIRLYNGYMYFPSNSKLCVAVPVTEGQKVIVTFSGGNGSTEAGFTFSNATVDGDESATQFVSDDTEKTVTLTATATGYVNLYNTKSKVKLYRIQVNSETRATLDLRDTSNSYEKNVGTGTTSATNNHFNHRVKFSPDGALTYDSDYELLHIESTDPTILDASHAYIASGNFGNSSSFYFNNIIPLKAGKASLIITFDGNNDYKPMSYTSQEYTVYGPGSILVQAEDQEIQEGQFSNIEPKITDKDGNLIGIKEMSDGSGRYTVYALDEEENIPDYSNFFDFTYAVGSGSGENYDKITVDATGKVETEEGDVAAAVGAYRTVTITATPKTAYASAFDSSEGVSTNITLTIIEKVKNPQFNLYWNAECTETYRITPTYDPETQTWTISSDVAHQADDKQWIFDKGVFANGFPNGRMLYVKTVNEGDSIWFSYAQNEAAATIPANPSIDKNKRIFQYRRGIPIYIDDDLSEDDYVTVNIVATSYNASTRKRNLNGSVARLKFPKITTHGRPAEPTYNPISPDAVASENKDGRKIMNTSENVVAYGEGASNGVSGVGNLVYGKFSTSSVYTTEQLINEANVQRGIDNVPVVSTEVAKRRFTAVQIKNYNDTYGYGDYISEQTYTEYWYLYNTDIRITPDRYDISVNPNSADNATVSGTPEYTVTWYNKKTAKYQEVDSYDGKITYTVASRNGASNATLNTDGTVSAGSEPGWVRVKITYTGGEQHGGVSGEPQYVSTTDESFAYYYVYITDPLKEQPVITPPTRNFTGTMTYKITAPEHWNVRYNIGVGNVEDPTVSSGTELAYGQEFTQTIGSSMTPGQTFTVKAIAYNPNNSGETSVVVSESYTLRDPLPDPVFDPNGVPAPYVYNTSELTVQIACAYGGSVIYYTISDEGEEGTIYPDPVIGASNTYLYNGLSKVTVTGNKVIRAIAYDPVQEIYSRIKQSTYEYSDRMNKPYFQASNDGITWYGFDSNGSWTTIAATYWNSGQAHEVTPYTQIRIVDPNPVKGTIFYTVGGTVNNGIVSVEAPTPANNTTSLIYSEGYPFTVTKPSQGKAITMLEDASSGVATAVFTMPSGYSHVWEAVDETLSDSINGGSTISGRKGIHIEDGFVISTEENLYVRNTGTIVNSHSLASGNTSGTTYAQEFITATFGGYDLASWEQMTIADAAIGAPIGNVGDYSIKTINNTGIGNGNARDEHNSNYNHVYSYKTTPAKTGGEATEATTHEKTFKVPAIGGYVRFEPEKDGDLTIWCLQQGAILYENDKYFIPNVLRIRPVYMVDEQGKSLQVKVVNNVPQLWSAARLSENWERIEETAKANSWMDSKLNSEGTDMVDDDAYAQYLRFSDGALFQEKPSDYNTTLYKRVLNKGPNRAETAAIYQLYKADLDKNHVERGQPIKPFAIHTGSNLSLNGGMYVDDSNDGTGYVLASGGYAKYTFEVKAGKTYFFFAQGSKIGIRGFQFVPTETGTRPKVEIDKAETTNVSVDETSMTLAKAIEDYGDKPVDVTLKRNFTTNWTTLVLPFSVSVAQVEKLFGPQTDIIIFDDITDGVTPNNTIHMTRHWHKMIVAGTPIIIKPTVAVENPEFKGVHLETTDIDEITGSHCRDFTMTGTFLKSAGALKKDDWYINGSGNFTYLNIAQADVNGSYCWLRKKTGVEARMLSTGMSDALDEMVFDDDDDDDNTTTGFIGVELPTGKAYVNIMDADTNVYNTSGQIVSKGSVRNLPKGVYIVNGKKMVIK